MLTFVVPTVGRWSALTALVDSLDRAGQAGHKLGVVVVDQSGETGHPQLSARHLDLRWVRDAGRGASRARNLGLRFVHGSSTHVVWPNDHTVYDGGALDVLATQLPHSDVVVGALIEGRSVRYNVASRREPLDPSNVWEAIEPVTCISVAALRAVGGWDEGLGAGSRSPWQSSALADLLLRVRPHAPTVAWDPGFCAVGEGFARGASDVALSAKLRSYGRGYGRVLSTWDYPLVRRLGSIAKPLLQRGYAVGPDVLPMRARVASSVGRAEGVVGHLPGLLDRPA